MAGPATEGQPSAKTSALRRSQRVCLSVEVEVTLQRTGQKSTGEVTRTLIVSAHGALILLHQPIAVGELLTLRNVRSDQQAACRVVDLSPGTSGVPEVGIEFLVPHHNFWHISFPPADWSPRGPESKTYGPQVVLAMSKQPKSS